MKKKFKELKKTKAKRTPALPLGFRIVTLCEEILEGSESTRSATLARLVLKLTCYTCGYPARECSDADGPDLTGKESKRERRKHEKNTGRALDRVYKGLKIVDQGLQSLEDSDDGY